MPDGAGLRIGSARTRGSQEPTSRHEQEKSGSERESSVEHPSGGDAADGAVADRGCRGDQARLARVRAADGMLTLCELFDGEAEMIAGPKGRRVTERTHHHWGTTRTPFAPNDELVTPLAGLSGLIYQPPPPPRLAPCYLASIQNGRIARNCVCIALTANSGIGHAVGVNRA
jgi:hypothetical protein